MQEEAHLVSHLQSLDLQTSALEKEIAALPKHIAAIEKTLESHLRRLEADRAALSANQRDRKKLEGDIQTNEQKLSKLREQMAGAKNNEQYKAFQHEIAYAQGETRKAEDRILELMTASEPLEAAVKRAEADLKDEKKSVEAESKSARERTAVDEAKLSEIRTLRAEAAAKLKPNVLSTYERIRKKWKGVSIAEGTTGRCGACMIVLRPQFFQDLRRGEALLTCESCGRFLFYNPAVLATESGTRVSMS